MALKRLGLVVFCIFLSSCFGKEKLRSLEKIKESGELVVLTRNSSLSYFTDRNGQPAGFEYELVNAFAKSLGIKVKFKMVNGLDEMMDKLENGEADMIASGMTATVERKKRFLMSHSYLKIHQQLVCKKIDPPMEITKLTDADLVVVKGSSYEERLKELQRNWPSLKWRVASDQSTEQLLNMVWNEQIDCTIADSNIVDNHKRYMTELKVGRNMTEKQELAWFFPLASNELKSTVDNWLLGYESKNFIKVLSARYFDDTNGLNDFNTKTFREVTSKKLPEYKKIFQNAAKKYHLDWRLLVAISFYETRMEMVENDYQVGLMGLSRDIGKKMGIQDVGQPAQHIFGGARYLSLLYELQPDYLKQEDKLRFAIAAYNFGMDHLIDARNLAILQNKNPNTWEGVSAAMPLMSHPRYYKDLKHGYAQGIEPVIYVNRILSYVDGI